MKYWLIAVVFSNISPVPLEVVTTPFSSLQMCELAGHELHRLIPADRRIRFNCVVDPEKPPHRYKEVVKR